MRPPHIYPPRLQALMPGHTKQRLWWSSAQHPMLRLCLSLRTHIPNSWLSRAQQCSDYYSTRPLAPASGALRGSNAASPCRFMRHTAVVLGGVQKHVLPEIAALIVEELVAQLKEADEAMTRYHGQCRKMAKSLIQMRTERVRLRSCALNLWITCIGA